MLRMAILASSASLLHCFVSARRRSSVSAGMARRITSPLFSGMMPTSESIMAFSMAWNMLLSQGLMAMVRESGVEMAETLLSGTWLP